MQSSSTWAEISGLFTGAGAQLNLPWERLPINDQGPIVDIGAGTGLQTVLLADALPDRDVIAIEPDDGMRVALMTRLTDRADLRDRVTVYPWSLEEVPADMRFAAALLHNVVYEFADPHASLAKLVRHLPAGAPVIANHLHIASTAEPVESRLLSSTTMGRLRYERWFERRPGPDGRMEVVNTYRTVEGETVIRSTEERRSVVGLDNQRVAELSALVGFAVDGTTAPGYWILTAPSAA